MVNIPTEYPSLATLTLNISPGRIAYLKFILEGYDGLAILSTLDAGKVVLRFPAELRGELQALLDEILPACIQA